MYSSFFTLKKSFQTCCLSPYLQRCKEKSISLLVTGYEMCVAPTSNVFPSWSEFTAYVLFLTVFVLLSPLKAWGQTSIISIHILPQRFTRRWAAKKLFGAPSALCPWKAPEQTTQENQSPAAGTSDYKVLKESWRGEPLLHPLSWTTTPWVVVTRQRRMPILMALAWVTPLWNDWFTSNMAAWCVQKKITHVWMQATGD